MNDRADVPPPPTDWLTATCPSCGTRGPSVGIGTVKAILTESALRRIERVSHRFCETAECPVVYYDEAGATFGRRDLRVRVWQKEPIGDRPACYCFGETEATIREEFMRKGSSDAIDRVRAHIKANRCATCGIPAEYAVLATLRQPSGASATRCRLTGAFHESPTEHATHR